MRVTKMTAVFLVAMTIMLVTGCAGMGGGERQNTILEDGIPYRTVGEYEMKLVLARPARGRGPFPGLVYIPSGGNFKFDSRKELLKEINKAAERGYVAVSIEFCPVAEYPAVNPFPAQIHDAKCAVRWLRANARRYRIDPERIGVVGHGFSGNVAMMLGVTDPSDGLEGDCEFSDVSSRVQAVVNWSAPGELVSFYKQVDGAVRVMMLHLYLGGSPEEFPDAYRMASPVSYASKGDAPVLSIMPSNDNYYGPMDKHGEMIGKTFKEAGVPHEMIVIRIPNTEEIPYFDFLDKHLKVGK